MTLLDVHAHFLPPVYREALATAGIAALLTIVERERVMYGSDWPFTPEPAVKAGLGWLTSPANPVQPGDRTANALSLFPRFASFIPSTMRA